MGLHVQTEIDNLNSDPKMIYPQVGSGLANHTGVIAIADCLGIKGLVSNDPIEFLIRKEKVKNDYRTSVKLWDVLDFFEVNVPHPPELRIFNDTFLFSWSYPRSIDIQLYKQYNG